MKTKITKEKNGRLYEYINLTIKDLNLTDYHLSTIWNYGVECYKYGDTITITLRKPIKY